MKVNLILGSGAARGLMHIGAIRALLDQGYEIESIIGISVGAFIGILYAKTRDIDTAEKIVRSFEFQRLFHLDIKHHDRLSLRLKRSTITRYFTEVIGDKTMTFKDLDFPFAIVATNLLTTKTEYFYEGRILPALFASGSLPLINPPVIINHTPYIDGGLILNIPRTIPIAFRNPYPYIGINVAYGKQYRGNHINLQRRAFVSTLSFCIRHGTLACRNKAHL